MIPSIISQRPTLSPLPAMSSRTQAHDTRESLNSTGEMLSMEGKNAPPKGQRDPTHYPLYTRRPTGTDLQFRVDENTEQVVITVLRQDTGEVIREIPLKTSHSVTPTLDPIWTGQVIHAIA